jgi:hypothetical protein
MTGEQLKEWTSLGGTFIGLALSVVAFVSQSVALLVLGLTILIVAGVSFFFLYRSAKRLDREEARANEAESQREAPPFHLLNVEKTLTFDDKDAQRAICTDTRTIRANHKGLSGYWFKDLVPASALKNILIDDEPPHQKVDELSGTRTRVIRRFPNDLAIGQEFTHTLTFDAHGAFPDKVEFLEHRVMDPTDRLHTRIQFHPERPCLDCKVYVGLGGGALEPLEGRHRRLDKGKRLDFKVEKPTMGNVYRIEWDWQEIRKGQDTRS